MKSILRSVWPELLMVAIMAVLALAFMSPVFEGKTLYQNDIVQAKHMSAEVDKFQKETGEYSAWTNSAFGGMPAYQIKGAPSRNVFQWLFHALKLFLPGYTVAILFICMLGFYFLLRTIKLDKWLALAGAIAFGFGAHNLQLIGAGHVSKIYAIAYMAPVIAGVLLVFKRKYLAGGLVTAIGFGIQLVTNHVQVSYYTGMILLVYFCVELVYAIKDKYFDHLVKSGVTILIAVLVAVLPNMTNLLTTMEYSRETTRGKSELVKEGTQTKGLDLEYITQWSYGIGETMNLFIPNLYGGGGSELKTSSATHKVLQSNNISDNNSWRYVQSQTYWGSQPFTAGPHYIGAITIFLAILGLMIIRRKEKWWLCIVIVISIFLAWGKNFMGFTEFFVNNVPLFSKFRDATNSLIIAQIAIPILAFLAVRDWFAWEAEPKVKLKKLYIGTGIAGGIALLFAIVPTLAGSFTGAADAGLPEWLREPLRTDRIALARHDAIRTLIFVVLAAGVLWYSLRATVKKEYLYIGLAVLILADMWMVDKRYLNKDNFSSKSQYAQALKPWPADEAILKNKDLSYRVFDVTASPFRSGHASGFHKSLGGYHGAKLGRYDELSEKYMIPYVAQLQGLMNVEKPSLESFQQAVAAMPVLHMMNTQYLILRPNLPLRNPDAYGNAWYVDRIKWAANANEELEAVGSIQLTNEAVINQRFKDQVRDLPAQLSESSQPDAIKLVEYKPNYLKYEAEASQNRLAVFSEIYYPYGWQAYVDGKETNHIRADYTLRAMVIPAGKHTVEFRFDPQSLKTGQTISLIGTILVLLLIVGMAVVKGTRLKAQE
jgi:hypothetical protein